MIKNILKLISGTLLSRIFGFLRELVYAYYFGASYFMDIWVVASNIPNLFREILGEKVVESVFIPAYHRVKKQFNTYAVKKFSISFFVSFVIALFAVFALLKFFLKDIIIFFAPGLPPNYITEAVSITNITLYYTIIIGISAFFGAFLMIAKKYFQYSVAPAIANIVHVLFILIFFKTMGRMTLPYAFVVAGISMCLSNFIFFLLSSKKMIFAKHEYFDRQLLKKEKKSTYLQSVPIFFEMIFNKLSSIVDRRLASLLAEGSISSLYYSFRLIQLPFALIALAINRVVMVDFSKSRSENNILEQNRLSTKGFFLNVLAIMPIILIYLLFSKEIVSLIYKRGAFDSTAVNKVSFTMIFYSIGLFPMAINSLFTRILYVSKYSKIVMFHSVVSLSINIVLNYILYKTSLKSGGIALATTISFFINMILNWNYCYKNVIKINFFKQRYFTLVGILPFFPIYFIMTSNIFVKILYALLFSLLWFLIIKKLRKMEVI